MNIIPYTKVRDFNLSTDILLNDSIVIAIDNEIATEFQQKSNGVVETSKKLEPLRIVEGSNVLATETPPSLSADDLTLLNKESQLDGRGKTVINCKLPDTDTDIASKMYVRNAVNKFANSRRIESFVMKDSNGDLYSVTMDASELKLRKLADVDKIKLLPMQNSGDFYNQLCEITRVLNEPHIDIVCDTELDTINTFLQIVETFPTSVSFNAPTTYNQLVDMIETYISAKNKDLENNRSI